MDFLSVSPSSWCFVGDVDEAATIVLSTITTPPASTQSTLPKAEVSRVRTMSADANSWIRPSNYANAPASMEAAKTVPEKLVKVASEDTHDDGADQTTANGPSRIDERESPNVKTAKTFPKQVVQTMPDYTKVETSRAVTKSTATNVQAATVTVADEGNLSSGGTTNKTVQKNSSDSTDVETPQTITRVVSNKLARVPSNDSFRRSRTEKRIASGSAVDDVASPTKPTEVSLIATLKANLFKDDATPKQKLVRASSLRITSASERGNDALDQTVTSPTINTKSSAADNSRADMTLLRPPLGAAPPRLARSDSCNPHVLRRASADSSCWLRSQKTSVEEKQDYNKPSMSISSTRLDSKASMDFAPTISEGDSLNNSGIDSPVEPIMQNAFIQGKRTDKLPLSHLPPRLPRRLSTDSVSKPIQAIEPKHANSDSTEKQAASTQGKTTDRPPLGPLSPRLTIRRASADCRPVHSLHSTPLHDKPHSKSSADQVKRQDKPPLVPLSPRLTRRASTDSGSKSVQQSAPSPTGAVAKGTIPRRASTDSSSWLQAQNVSIHGKRIDPKKECALNSSISDLKSMFTGTNETKLSQNINKVDPRQDCTFNSSVRELKEVFDPTVVEMEPEEPEFDLLDSPIREARKSAKILEAISQLGKSCELAIPKIDPLDEMLNSSKASLGSFAKSSEDDKHYGEGSLTDIFEKDNSVNPISHTKEASGHGESKTEESSEVEEEESVPVLPEKLSKEERRRRARMLWQSEQSMNASFVQSSPNSSFVQNSTHASMTAISSDG